MEDSGDRMEQILNIFTGFLIEANVSLRFYLWLPLSLYLCLFVQLSESLFLSPCRTDGTTPRLWCQRPSGFSREGSPTQRLRRSGILSVPSSQAWRTSYAEQRRVAESCRSWSTCAIFVSRFVFDTCRLLLSYCMFCLFGNPKLSYFLSCTLHFLTSDFLG